VIAAALALVAVPSAVLLSTTSSDALDYVNPLLEAVAAWSLGYGWRAHRVEVTALAERAEHMRRAAAAEAAALTAREREGIGREMHDVLAHAITLMVVQAEAGPVGTPDTKDAAFAAISQTGRQALVDLRRVLSGIRPLDPTAQRSPQPDLTQLPSLVDEANAAGTPISLDIRGDVAGLPRAVSFAGYRIVQESLTNAVRHAQGQPTRVVVRANGEDLDIAIDSGAVQAANQVAEFGAGRGIAGMRERATALGGSLQAGPRATGGWRVEARLPLSPAAPR
jgi:signal transduction histidine kinase